MGLESPISRTVQSCGCPLHVATRDALNCLRKTLAKHCKAQFGEPFENEIVPGSIAVPPFAPVRESWPVRGEQKSAAERSLEPVGKDASPLVPAPAMD